MRKISWTKAIFSKTESLKSEWEAYENMIRGKKSRIHIMRVVRFWKYINKLFLRDLNCVIFFCVHWVALLNCKVALESVDLGCNKVHYHNFKFKLRVLGVFSNSDCVIQNRKRKNSQQFKWGWTWWRNIINAIYYNK